MRVGRCLGVFSTKGSSSEDGVPDSPDRSPFFSPSIEFVSLFSGCAVRVAGSGSGNVPVTMSASQSPRPPGAASTAV